jgi:WhiB family redox-sensing transcriptional regulator
MTGRTAVRLSRYTEGAASFAQLLDLPLVVDAAWVADAVCAQTDPDAFYPEKGEPTRAAKAMCARCPVTEQCLEYALENNERYGVWGGLSERERRALQRQRRASPGDRREVGPITPSAKTPAATTPSGSVPHPVNENGAAA